MDGERRTPIRTTSAVDFGLQQGGVSTRGTKWDLTYEQLSQVSDLVISEKDESIVDEFILNLSLDDVLGGDSGSLLPSFNDLTSFLTTVSTIYTGW